MTNPINESGQSLEIRLRDYLIKNKIQHKYQKSGQKEIDFIIEQPDGREYADCTNQNVGGRVEDKIPQKIRKYFRQYKFPKIFIIKGNYKISTEVLITCDEDAKNFGYEYVICSFDEFVSRLDGTYNSNPLGI